MSGCASHPNFVAVNSQNCVFQLRVDPVSLRKSIAHISITVPNTVRVFEAPADYAGAPMFLQYLSNLTAVDSDGRSVPLKTVKNRLEMGSTASPTYALSYDYNVPQKVSGEVHKSLPTLDEAHGRFDNNLTFLLPLGAQNSPACLIIEAPKDWIVATSWGMERTADAGKVSDLTSGMIVFGGYRFSDVKIGGMIVHFAIRGQLSDEILKKYFVKVFSVQKELAGPLPAKEVLIVFQDGIPDKTAPGVCSGSALTNSLIVDIPSSVQLEPFNFQAIGTISHELFHLWNLRYVTSASEDGAYLFSEGFTNYFAVAALVRAQLITAEQFARFLSNYRTLLEKNPKYPGTDYAAIQKGFSTDQNCLDLAYTKGPFVAVLLDIALRKDTNGVESLASWFRALCGRFGGKKGYTVEDLRALIAEKSGKSDGLAVKTFDQAFVGGEALDLNGLFLELGVKCASPKNCTLDISDKKQVQLRDAVFSAR